MWVYFDVWLLEVFGIGFDEVGFEFVYDDQCCFVEQFVVVGKVFVEVGEFVLCGVLVYVEDQVFFVQCVEYCCFFYYVQWIVLWQDYCGWYQFDCVGFGCNLGEELDWIGVGGVIGEVVFYCGGEIEVYCFGFDCELGFVVEEFVIGQFVKVLEIEMYVDFYV